MSLAEFLGIVDAFAGAEGKVQAPTEAEHLAMVEQARARRAVHH